MTLGETTVKECDFNIIDFHAHVLPGVDHGSDSLDNSLLQLDLAAKSGVKRVVATPHFYPDRHSVEDFLDFRHRAFSSLCSAVSEAHPALSLGAEVLICDGIERLSGLSELCVKGTNVILLELPFTVFNPSYADSVFRLTKDGFCVVLAHVDRYPSENIELLCEAGAKMQVNAGALCGLFVPGHIKKWLSGGRVIALGSDIHMEDKGAYKRFEKAKSRILRLGHEKVFVDFSRFLEAEIKEKQGV